MIRYSSRPKKISIRGKLSEFYFYRMYDTDTKKRSWRSTGKTSLKGAHEQRRQWELDDARGVTPANDVLFSKAVKEWLDFKEASLTPVVIKTYRTYANPWISKFPKNIKVRHITISHVENYFILRAREVKGATVNKVRTMMRQFFNWCINKNYCKTNPTITIKKFREEEREIRALEPEEIEVILNTCRESYKSHRIGNKPFGKKGEKKYRKKCSWAQNNKPPTWLYEFTYLAIQTGFRAGTLVSLLWSHVDFKQRLIRIPPDNMKGREGIDFPINQELLGFLNGLRQKTTSVKVLDLPTFSCVEKTFKRMVKRSGLAPTRIHDLRATFITKCARAGILIEIVQSLVGHKDIKITQKFYRKIKDIEKREAVAKLMNPSAGGF